MNMKKALALLLLSANIFALTACQSEDDNMISEELVNYNNYSYKMGAYTTTTESYGVSNQDLGLSNVSTTFLTYITDENGIIQEIEIDEVETSIYFDETGQLTNYTAGEVLTKKELGDNYGMRAASPIKKEWYEQINALEEYMIGKNISTFLAAPNAKARTSYNNYSADNIDYYSQYSDNIPYGYDGNYTNGDIIGNERSISPSENYAMEITENTNSMPTTSEINSHLNSTDSTTTNSENSSMIDSTNSADNTVSMDNSSSIIENDSLNPEAESWKADLTASVTIDTTNIMLALQNAYESNY